MPPACVTLSLSVMLLLEAACFQIRAATSLLPGVRLYATPQELEGRLVFLVANQQVTRARSNEIASIYLYDLRKRALKRVTDCPNGLLIPSRTAELFCVLSYDDQSPAARRPILYSDAAKKSCTVQLERPPSQTLLIGHHAFFVIEREEYMVDFDFDTRTETLIGRRGSVSWGGGRIRQLSQNLQVPEGRDTLHFMYNEREVPTGGPRHETGFYDLDIRSGRIEWSPQQQDPDLFFRAFNGHFVYFTGPDSPLHGFKLVVSPSSDDQLSSLRDPQGRLTRTLRDFPRHAILGGAYTLECMSPDARYALVSYYRGPGCWRAFYVVNVSTGKTDLLFKDKSTLGGPIGYYPVWWLP
jgi:hypothetical protein